MEELELEEGSDGGSWVRELMSIGTPSEGRVLMIFSRSSTAIWWVSRSESLEREVRIRDLSSTMARWEERDEEEEEEGLVVVWDDGDLECLDEGFEEEEVVVVVEVAMAVVGVRSQLRMSWVRFIRKR